MEKQPIPIKQLIVGKEFSLFDIIEQAFSFTGSCEMKVCTYSVSEDGVRFIEMLKAKGLISKASFVLDNSCLENKFETILYLSTESDVYFTGNHAKYIILKGQHEHLAIITSSNFNTIKRSELFKLEYDQALIHELIAHFEKTIANSYHYE